MNGTKIASKAKARLANFMGKVFGKLQYPKGQSILSKAQFHIKLGARKTRIPQPHPETIQTPKSSRPQIAQLLNRIIALKVCSRNF